MDNGNRATLSRVRAARRLLEGTERLATIFRRQNTVWVDRGFWLSPLLDGLVEPFLRKIGEELLAVRPDPAVPWSRAGGLLRLSPSRGEEALVREIAWLRAILREAVEPLEGEPHDEEAADFVDAAVDVLSDGALDELARLEGRRPTLGAPRFGGVVLELFEDPRLIREAFRGPEAGLAPEAHTH